MSEIDGKGRFESTSIKIDGEPLTVNLLYIGQMRGALQILAFYKSDAQESYVRREKKHEGGYYTQDWHKFESLRELQEIAGSKHFALEAFVDAMTRVVH